MQTQTMERRPKVSRSYLSHCLNQQQLKSHKPKVTVYNQHLLFPFGHSRPVITPANLLPVLDNRNTLPQEQHVYTNCHLAFPLPELATAISPSCSEGEARQGRPYHWLDWDQLPSGSSLPRTVLFSSYSTWLLRGRVWGPSPISVAGTATLGGEGRTVFNITLCPPQCQH